MKHGQVGDGWSCKSKSLSLRESISSTTAGAICKVGLGIKCSELVIVGYLFVWFKVPVTAIFCDLHLELNKRGGQSGRSEVTVWSGPSDHWLVLEVELTAFALSSQSFFKR